MNIFESLENLNISEECFDDILSMVELILNEEDSLDDGSHIRRKYGNPEYKKDEKGELQFDKKGYAIPANKSAELYAKAHPNHPDEPSYSSSNGRGFGEYGKRAKKGDSDRISGVSYSTPKEIQEPLSVAKSQEKGARKLLDKNEFNTIRDKIKAKRLLQGALRSKSQYLRKKAEHIDNQRNSNGIDYETYDGWDDRELMGSAEQRKEAAKKASAEANRIGDRLMNPHKEVEPKK